jgi:MoxR-like ATPase
MARSNRRSRSIRAVSPTTAKRLATQLAQLGRDALQPSAATLALPWAVSVMAAFRPVILTALRTMSGGSAGFDYGPVGLTICRWITVNRLARYPDPAAVWAEASHGRSVSAAVSAAPVAPPAVAPVNPPVPPVVIPAAAPAVAAAPAAAPPVTPVPPAGTEPLPSEVPEADEPVAVDAAAVPVPPARGALSPMQKLHPEWNWQPAAKVFGIRSLWGNVAVWPRQGATLADGSDAAHPDTPDVDPDYVWTAEHLQWAVFCAGESPARGVWFWGNRGAGKTEFAKQFAAATGRPFFAITFTDTMEPSEFIGDMGAAVVNGNGGSVWQDGTMLMALRCPIPAVVLLDEISLSKAGHISGPLNEIVHPNCAYRVARTGERIRFNRAHLFIAADNTNGTGDTTGMYQGAKLMNRATMDRFAYFRPFTYMPKAQEVKLLMGRAHCDKAIAERVWAILDALRKKVSAGQASDPPSMREAIAFCAALRGGFNERDAYESAFVGKYPEEMQEDMRVTFTATYYPGESAPPAP